MKTPPPDPDYYSSKPIAPQHVPGYTNPGQVFHRKPAILTNDQMVFLLEATPIE